MGRILAPASEGEAAGRGEAPEILMCGIVGYTGDQSASEILVGGLKRLEYRGYDSAGVAIVKDGELELRRAEGKLKALEAVLKARPVSEHGDGPGLTYRSASCRRSGSFRPI